MNIEILLETLKTTEIQPSSVAKRLVAHSYRLKKLFNQLADLAPEWDYPGVPHNGLRTLMKIILRLTVVVVDCIYKNESLSTAADTVTLFGNIAEAMIAQAVVQSETDRRKSKSPRKYDVFLEDVSFWWQFARKNQSLLTSYFANHMLFFVDPALQSFIVNFTHSLAALRSPQDAMGCAINPLHRGKVISQLLIEGSLYYPLKVWSVLDNKLFNSVSSWQANKFNVLAKTIYVSRQNRFIIPFDGKIVQDQYKSRRCSSSSPITTDNPIRCRLLRSKNYLPNGKLVVHISGGGFVMFKPEINEGCYLRYWAGNLEGTTILSIDYTKLVVYPKAFQEVLDVYLWATSGSDEVTEMLGFQPEEVVLCGDSAGSHLAFAICRALKDLHQKDKNERSNGLPIFPTAFVSFYGNMSVVQNQCSLSMTCLEAALTPSVILSLYGLVASGLVLNSDEEIDGIAAYSNPNPIRDSFRTWLCHGKNWFDCPTPELKKRFEVVRRDTGKAYLRPMTEKDLNKLNDLNLYLVVGEFDCFLDGSINIAKAWKGKVHLEVVKNVNHGFLSYSKISEECKYGSRVGLSRLREALDL